MKEKYKIKLWMDNEYAVYENKSTDYVFRGTIEQVNAWISLKEKGFDF